MLLPAALALPEAGTVLCKAFPCLYKHIRSPTDSGFLLFPYPTFNASYPLFSKPCRETCFLRSPPSKSCLSTPQQLDQQKLLIMGNMHLQFFSLTKAEIAKYQVRCFLVFLPGNIMYFSPLTAVKRWGKKGCHVFSLKRSYPSAYAINVLTVLSPNFILLTSFQNSCRIHSGKYVVWMPAAPTELLKGQIISFIYWLRNKTWAAGGMLKQWRSSGLSKDGR